MGAGCRGVFVGNLGPSEETKNRSWGLLRCPNGLDKQCLSGPPSFPGFVAKLATGKFSSPTTHFGLKWVRGRGFRQARLCFRSAWQGGKIPPKVPPVLPYSRRAIPGGAFRRPAHFHWFFSVFRTKKLFLKKNLLDLFRQWGLVFSFWTHFLRGRLPTQSASHQIGWSVGLSCRSRPILIWSLAPANSKLVANHFRKACLNNNPPMHNGGLPSPVGEITKTMLAKREKPNRRDLGDCYRIGGTKRLWTGFLKQKGNWMASGCR